MKCLVIGREDVLTKSNAEIVNEISASLESEETAAKVETAEVKEVTKTESAKVEGGKVVFEVNVIPAELQAAVEEVASIVENKGDDAFLKMVEVTADKGKLKLTTRKINCYKNAISISKTIPANVVCNQQGFYIPAKNFVTFAKLTASGENVNLCYDGKKNLTFTSGKHKMNAVAVEGKDFDKTTTFENIQDYLPKIEKAKSFSVDAEIFGAVVKKVVTAAADKKCFQQFYKGVFVEVEGNKITLSATDGVQVASVEVDILDAVKETTQFLIYAESLKTVAKTIDKGILKVEFNDDVISFTSEGTRIESTLLDKTNYPAEKLKEMLPQELKASAVVNTAELKNAVASAGIIAKATDGTIKFNFKTDSGLIIESLADGTGAAKIYCPAVASRDTTAAVNFARLNRALSGITAEYVMVGKATANGADILTIHDNNESFCYFISEISKKRDLQKSAEHIEQLELEIAKEDSEVEAEREKVAQAQKVIKEKESEIEIAEEILKSAKKNLRQAKNALKKAEDTQKDAETINLRQQAIDKAEGEVADAKKALEEKQAQHKKLAEWIDSFPVQKVYEKFNWLAEQLANAKNSQAELKKANEWLATVAA